ncbi:MAG: EVE domain-containing protein [Phycisphaerae bacterium]|nr:EVE domain-containing protein [Phycisphaerae bacterium]
MATYLLKTEPSEFSYGDLDRRGPSRWDGVSNAQALEVVRSMRVGDEALIYHTAAEKRIAGLARVVRAPYPDPKRPALTADGRVKFPVVDLRAVRPAGRPDATLAAIKADPRFAGLALVRHSRLSAMAVPPELDAALRALAGL